MKKRVLIGYAEYGSGHKSVAQYIKNYFDDKNKYEVMMLNLSEYSNSIGKWGDRIFKRASKNEFFYTFFYKLFNNRIASKGNAKLCEKSFDNEDLRKVLKDFNPDFVISTHFYVSYMASFYNKENVINSKVMTVITDFLHHDWWTINHKETDYYVVANDIIKNKLIKFGVDEDKIYPYGIPINLKETENLEDKEYVLKKYSLSGEKPIYLFFSGGSEGYDYTFDYFKALVKANLKIDIIFICGKNKDLKLRCENFLLKNDIKNVLVLGYTKDVFNLLNISGMVITKPGGTTLNECILMKKPCILIPGVGGQENYNARFMTKNHYAVKVRGARKLVRKVKSSLKYPFIVNSMINKLKKRDESDSCKKIYDLTDKILAKK